MREMLICAAALALAGCVKNGADTSVTTYRCADGRVVSATYPDADTARLRLDGENIVLKTAVSASGARYVGAGREWWTKGPDQGRLSRVDQAGAAAEGVDCVAR